MGLVTFLLHVHTVTGTFHGSVTSWLRSTKHNAAVGGKPGSLHLLGLAVDLIFDDPDEKAQAAHSFARAGLWTINEGDHLHVQAWAPTGMDHI